MPRSGSDGRRPGAVDERGRREERPGPLRHLDGHLGVLARPRPGRPGRRWSAMSLGVLLGQQPHEHAAHDALGRPVVGRPVPLAQRPPSARRRPAPSGGAAGPPGSRRPGRRPPALAVEEGHPGEHQPLDPVGHQCARAGRPPGHRRSGRPPRPGRPGRPGSSKSGSRWRAYSSEPHGSGGGGRGPEAEQVEARRRQRARAGLAVGRRRRGAKSMVGRAASRGGRAPCGTPAPRLRRTGDRRRTTSAPAHPTDSLSARRGDHRGPGGGRCLTSGPPATAVRSDAFDAGHGRPHRGPAPGRRLARRGALHHGRGRVGQDPGADPAGGPPHPGRVGRGRPHRRLHLHPQGRPRAPRPARDATASRSPRRPRAGGAPGPGRPGRHPPPAGAHPAPPPGPRRRSAASGGGRPPVPDWSRDHRRRPGRGLGGRHRDRLGQGQLPRPGHLRRAARSRAGRAASVSAEQVAEPFERLRSARSTGGALLDLDDVLVRAADLLLDRRRLRRAACTGGTAICRSTSSRT